jgi:uncharacterized protein (DUF1697 family)
VTATVQYLALLRGINVGGKNLIKMNPLKACFEEQGFSNVATYIQSGNVLFQADEPDRAKLALRIEVALAATFNYRPSVVLRSLTQMRDVLRRAPEGFGAHPARYRYDVIFLKEPLTAPSAMKSVLTTPGVDRAHPGIGALYFRRLISKAAQSRLNRLVSLPIYQRMTIRNWNTTTTLLRMMEEMEK